MDLVAKYLDVIDSTEPIKYTGRVTKVQGLLIESHGPQAVVGEVCKILIPRLDKVAWAEVAGLHGQTVQLMAYTGLEGIEVGCTVIASGELLQVPVSYKLLGRALDSMGHPMDGLGDIASSVKYPAVATPPDALTRRRIDKRIVSGIRSIDGLLPLGRGQRIGIFAGSGVGKSTLLGMVARNTNADVNVIALIGERGREVREFLENDLGEEGLARSVIIVSTSDTPPLARLRGAYVATAVAEFFRDQGADVMLLFDSVTRFARAQREIGLAIGEPPATRGYTPSVFDSLPKLLERSGSSSKGSITGIYTILVDGDDMDEPVADTVRGILDGHVVLTRKLAERFHYPAVDVLKSISRLTNAVTGPITQKAMGILRRLLATWEEAEDMINIGAYVKGSNPAIDIAIDKHQAIEAFLVQLVDEKAPILDTIKRLGDIAGLHIPVEEVQAFAEPAGKSFSLPRPADEALA
ncbi:MAG: flagellum-specific ATP synthase FliI [Spirochaetes bacterium GWD1_61_31]|nr:MAG: flagellum-specific ATP synthase FliI [Spirochaetes bacterium GWB1_60_80]OHD42176.1 MAG: flagellum-specific ATP synthase FliI [Spirochaetes bacterium GWD1_61_31]HAP43161.1 flagellum-specific ATP synthase FliI [Spirochaetaceae bacterium]HCQ87281.1 flagellum-specific ATP synthase FliI [Spirochaetaceae bacterium]